MTVRSINLYKFVAYALDFEGSLYISRTTGPRLDYRPTVRVANTSHSLLRALCSRVGFGHVSENGYKNNESLALIYYWTLSIEDIRTHLASIKPQLTLKKEQAALMLEALPLFKVSSGAKRPPEILDKLHQVYLKLCELNRKPGQKQDRTSSEWLLAQLKVR